jgi:hypothetical protein
MSEVNQVKGFLSGRVSTCTREATPDIVRYMKIGVIKHFSFDVNTPLEIKN